VVREAYLGDVHLEERLDPTPELAARTPQ
jgi:hypothetical protein